METKLTEMDKNKEKKPCGIQPQAELYEQSVAQHNQLQRKARR